MTAQKQQDTLHLGNNNICFQGVANSKKIYSTAKRGLKYSGRKVVGIPTQFRPLLMDRTAKYHRHHEG